MLKRNKLIGMILITLIIISAVGCLVAFEKKYIIIAKAQVNISSQQRKEAAITLKQRLSDKNFDSIVVDMNEKIIVISKKANHIKAESQWLFRKGHLCLLDEEGGILFDNAKLDFVESAEVRKKIDIINNELYEVMIKFKKEYIYDLEKILENNIGKSIMLVLDDELYADPIIRGKIFNGEFLMDAFETEEGAQVLAEVWMSKNLPCQFEIR